MNKNIQIRHSEERDLPVMLDIYSYARQFMCDHGNPLQWAEKGWPPEKLLREDIQVGRSYVAECEGKICATFCLMYGVDIDPTYRKIEGAWLEDTAYGVVHRVATNGTVKGAGEACIQWAYDKCQHLRIDTHGDNVVMQNLMKKMDFVQCGIIYTTEDPYPRIAYEKSPGILEAQSQK